MQTGTLTVGDSTTEAATHTTPALSRATHRRLSTSAWEALFRAQVAVNRRLQRDAVFKELSMHEYDVLYTLSKCPTTRLRLNELNRYVLLTQPSISRLVERLEARGLLSRRTADDDRRGVLVGLTEAGLELQRSVGREHVKDIHAVMSHGLDADELAQLERLTRKLAASLERD
ncbi:MarR family winged helix-turn-helix transcriptional regulator [Psychromicrobium xiongbiense]|uniref:MarR family winged helix-turn-helix transcriptional regulator n=1 Tax=Psychromicrobium xiongbiense TaxID=3051184 RepID=UPI0025569088|nr:MarR family transcriptional regulator [Psychromicrobium sp. YIM S02556]